MSCHLRYSRTTGVLAIVALVTMAAGCDGCSVADSGTSEQLVDAEALSGEWRIASYAGDEDGCRLQTANAPFERVKITVVDASDEADAERLALRLCPSDDTCDEKGIPENELRWDGELEQASVTHYAANLHHVDPVDTTCRLATEHTLLMPDGSELELTRSFYEIDVPTEGDEACNAELAEDYHPHMPCVRGETFRLTRTDVEPTS